MEICKPYLLFTIQGNRTWFLGVVEKEEGGTDYGACFMRDSGIELLCLSIQFLLVFDLCTTP